MNAIQLATKSDIRELDLKITGDMNLLKWMLGLMIASNFAIILKIFFPH